MRKKVHAPRRLSVPLSPETKATLEEMARRERRSVGMMGAILVDEALFLRTKKAPKSGA
jgi:hypothetical protein